MKSFLHNIAARLSRAVAFVLPTGFLAGIVKVGAEYTHWMYGGLKSLWQLLKNPTELWERIRAGNLVSLSSKKWPRIRRVVQVAIMLFFLFWIFSTRDGGTGVQNREGYANVFSPIHEAHRIVELKDRTNGQPRRPAFNEFTSPVSPLMRRPDGNYYSTGDRDKFVIPDKDGAPMEVRPSEAFLLDITNPNLEMDLRIDPSLKPVTYENLYIITKGGERYFYSRLKKENDEYLVPVYLAGFGPDTAHRTSVLKYKAKWQLNDAPLKTKGYVRGNFLGGAPLYAKPDYLQRVVQKITNEDGTKAWLMRTTIRYRGERQISILQWSPVAGAVTGLSLKEWVKDYWMAIALVVLAIPFGRFFCGWLCPMGISIDTFDKFFASRNEIKGVSDKAQPKYIKYVILVALIAAAILGVNIVGWFDPLPNVMRGVGLAAYAMGDGILKFFADHIFNEPHIALKVGEVSLLEFANPIDKLRFLPGAERWYQFLGSPFILIIFAGILMLGLIHKRFWCQHLCPLGAFYAAWSLVPGLKRVVDLDKCTNCMACEVNCRMNAIDHFGEQNIKGECIQCLSCLDDCNDDAIRFEFTTESDTRLKKDTPLVFNRKNFAFSMFAAALGFLIWRTGRTVETRSARQIIRPPGARTSVEGEDAFSQACIRCGECMKVCVNNALHPVPIGEGDLNTLWTPMLVPRLGSCEYKCTLCGEVCPTDAIRPFTFTEYADGSIDDRKWYLEEMEVKAAVDKESLNNIFYIKDPQYDIHFTAVHNYLRFHGPGIRTVGVFASVPGYMEIIRKLEEFGFTGSIVLFGDLNRILLERRLSDNDLAFYKQRRDRIRFVEFSSMHKLAAQENPANTILGVGGPGEGGDKESPASQDIPAIGRMELTLKEVNEINQATYSKFGVDMMVSASKKQRRFVGTAVFDETRCYPYLDHNPAPCTVCEEVCPVSDDSRGGKAIQVDKKLVYNRADQEWIEVQQPYLIHDICVGCGICEQECPSGKVDGFVVSRAAVYVSPPNYDYKTDDWDKKVRQFGPNEKQKLEEKYNKQVKPNAPKPL